MHRHSRFVLVLIALAVAGMASPVATVADPFWSAQQTSSVHAITVYRTPSCGCCKAWVSHLREHSFEVREEVLSDLSEVRTRHGVPAPLSSCHTGVADGHVFEGHVPAWDVKAVLEGRDDARLLSVPGMVSGSPGMDFPGAPRNAFAVIAQDEDGAVRVMRRYDGY